MSPVGLKRKRHILVWLTVPAPRLRSQACVHPTERDKVKRLTKGHVAGWFQGENSLFKNRPHFPSWWNWTGLDRMRQQTTRRMAPFLANFRPFPGLARLVLTRFKNGLNCTCKRELNCWVFKEDVLRPTLPKNAIGSQMQLVYFSALFQKMHEKLLFNMSLYIPIQPQILAWGRRLQTCECTRSSYYCQYVHSCSPELGSCRLYRSWASPIPVTKA